MNIHPRYLLVSFLAAVLLAGLPSLPAAQPAGGGGGIVVEVDPPDEPRRTRGGERDQLVVGRDIVVPAGETVRDLAVILGNVTVDGRLSGDLLVVGGTLTLNGRIAGDVAVIAGSADLGPNAQIGGDIAVIGGALTGTGSIGGDAVEVAILRRLPQAEGVVAWIQSGLLMGRPFVPGLGWNWLVAAGSIAIYLLVLLIFPRPVEACVAVVETRPGAALLSGLLVVALTPLATILLLVTVIGGFMVPFLIGVLIAGVAVGKAAVFLYVGRHLLGRFRPVLPGDVFVPLLIGALLFLLLSMIPILGFTVWGLGAALGLGAAAWAAMARIREPAPQGTAPAAPPPPQRDEPPLETLSLATLESPAPPESASPPEEAASRAGFWPRTAAGLIDLVLIGVLSSFFWDRMFWVFLVAYHVGFWGWRGTTIGGSILRLRIVRLDGRPIDFPVAIVRVLVAFLSAFALFLGFLWVAWDSERQSWHDKIAGTVIERSPRHTPLV